MKIPKEIKGKHRIRDFAICMDYIRGKRPEEIVSGRSLSITARRVEQIVYENRNFVNSNIAWPKSKRIWELQRAIENAKETRKDKADLIEQLRKEIEGDKPLIDQSTHVTEVTYVWQNDSDPVQPPELPIRNSQLEETL